MYRLLFPCFFSTCGLLAGTALLLAACGNHRQPQNPQNPQQPATLASRYEVVIPDTLPVYSPGDDTTDEYTGLAIDSLLAAKFPAEVAEAYFRDKGGLFGVYQFRQDAQVTALITRCPSMYWPSSVKIFFLHRQPDSIGGYVELAENWGDAGDVFVKKSWLYTDRGQLRALVWDHELHDHSVDDDEDTTVEDYNRYYILDLSHYRADTLTSDSALVAPLFARLRNKTR